MHHQFDEFDLPHVARTVGHALFHFRKKTGLFAFEEIVDVLIVQVEGASVVSRHFGELANGYLVQRLLGVKAPECFEDIALRLVGALHKMLRGTLRGRLTLLFADKEKDAVL